MLKLKRVLNEVTGRLVMSGTPIESFSDVMSQTGRNAENRHAMKTTSEDGGLIPLIDVGELTC